MFKHLLRRTTQLLYTRTVSTSLEAMMERRTTTKSQFTIFEQRSGPYWS